MSGINDAATRVDEKSAILDHAVFAHFLQAAALCANAGDEQEMVGRDLTDVLKHLSLGGTHDIHHVVFRAPLLCSPDHFFKETLTGFVFCELEVVTAFVACQCQDDRPLVFVFKERGEAVLAHVGSHGEGIDIEVSKNDLAYIAEVLPMSPRLASAMMKCFG